MPDMGSIDGSVSATDGSGPGGGNDGPGAAAGDAFGGAGGNQGGPDTSQSGVSMEAVAATGLAVAAAVTAAVAGSPMAIALATFSTLGAVGFVIEHGGITLGNANNPAGSPSAVAIGVAAIAMAQGVTLNATEVEATGVYDALGGSEQVAVADIITAGNTFYAIGAEYNPVLNQFIYATAGMDQILQNTQPGQAVIMNASGAMAVTDTGMAEVDALYGSALGGALNTLLPDGDVVTVTTDLQNMIVTRAGDWVNSFYNELVPDGLPQTADALGTIRNAQYFAAHGGGMGGGNT